MKYSVLEENLGKFQELPVSDEFFRYNRRRGMHIGYWWESQKERDDWKDQDMVGCTILKWILER
jgi:hypothetical protein